jgi:hypothetical protein
MVLGAWVLEDAVKWARPPFLAHQIFFSVLCAVHITLPPFTKNICRFANSQPPTPRTNANEIDKLTMASDPAGL